MINKMKMMKKILALAVMVLGMAGVSQAQTVAPSYPGGEPALSSYIEENLKYPADAKANGIEGVVGVMFTVKADGTIGSIKIKRMVDPDLESEAIRLVKGMPKWNPGTDNGVAVDSSAEVDIPFTLE